MWMKEYVCGIDIGTSRLKLTFVAQDGSVLGPFGRELETVYPQPLYAEQDPEQWYKLTCEILHDIFKNGIIDKHQIKAIMPDAATHTVVLLDSDFLPVRRAIMWNDQRSAALAAACECAEYMFERTNHMPSAMSSLFQNLWVKTYEPDIWKTVRYMLFPKDYLRFRMTGVYCTDNIDAEGTQFYDVHRREWSDTLCGLMGFSPKQLPPIRKATDIAGEVTSQSAKEMQLCEGTPVFVGTTDTALEMVAAGAINKEQATVKLATSGRICVISDKPYPHKQLVNYSHVVDGLYYPGTGTRSCATSLRWYKDCFAQAEKIEADKTGQSVYHILDEKASTIPAGSEGLFYHPFLLGEFSPYSNEDLRASFIGASMNHNEAHFIRAVMEGTSYSLRDCMAVIEQVGLKIDAEHIILIGGGSRSHIWSGILSDILGKCLTVSRYSDSSFGGALLAGVASGMFSSLEDAVGRFCRSERVIFPEPSNVDRYNSLFPIYKQLVSALMPIYEHLSGELKKGRDIIS